LDDVPLAVDPLVIFPSTSEAYWATLTSLVSISIPAFWLIRLLRRGDSPLA